MTLPDMSQALSAWEQSVTHRTIVKTTNPTTFVTTNANTDTVIKAVVQVGQPDDLSVSDIDYSLRVIKVHTKSSLSNSNSFIIYKGTTYKIIQVKDYSDYGYYRALCQQVRGSEA